MHMLHVAPGMRQAARQFAGAPSIQRFPSGADTIQFAGGRQKARTDLFETGSVTTIQPPSEKEIRLNRFQRAELLRMLNNFQVRERAFEFFEDARDPNTGLYYGRMPNLPESPLWQATNENFREFGYGLSPDTLCMAATGFGLATDVLKAEKGFFSVNPTIAKKEVEKRLNAALDSAEKMSRPENGWFLPHFISPQLENKAEISTVDTMLFYLGALAAAQYCGGKTLERAEAMFNRLDFEMMRTQGGDPEFPGLGISFGIQNGQIIPEQWGQPHYSEGVSLVTLPALGQKDSKVPTSIWTDGWSRNVNWRWGKRASYENHSLFVYFYPHSFLDFKGKVDGKGANLWAASQNAILMQQEYCEKRGYPKGVFGLTACDGPDGYKAYRAANLSDDPDNGTISLPAILACLPLAEKPVYQALQRLKRENLLDPLMNTNHGPLSAYNLNTGWKAVDSLCIDLGSMLLGLDAYQDGIIHRLMNKNAVIQRAFQRAGFRSIQ